MALGISRSGEPTHQFGGYDLTFGEALENPKWPSSWNSASGGTYTASIDLTSTKWNGTAHYNLCLMNAWSESSEVHYSGTFSFSSEIVPPLADDDSESVGDDEGGTYSSDLSGSYSSDLSGSYSSDLSGSYFSDLSFFYSESDDFSFPLSATNDDASPTQSGIKNSLAVVFGDPVDMSSGILGADEGLLLNFMTDTTRGLLPLLSPLSLPSGGVCRRCEEFRH
jgi:hypothetical protein